MKQDEPCERWDKVRRIWEIIDRLRGKGGCPWDRKQTPSSVQTYLIEEAHEAAAAVRSGAASEEVAEELGDLLFMTLFLVHLYEEDRRFTLEDVCEQITEKMVRRHPHVFGGVAARTAEEVKNNWEKIKADEKRNKNRNSSAIPDTLPALVRAYRIGSRLSCEENHPWNDVRQLLGKLRNGLDHLAARIEENEDVSCRDFAELLLHLVNLARLKGYRSEDCLHDLLQAMGH